MGYFSDLALEKVEQSIIEDHSELAIAHTSTAGWCHETKSNNSEAQIKQQNKTDLCFLYHGENMMFNDTVKDILEKHFGTPRKTLTIDGKSQRSNCIYFYTLKDKGKVLSIRDALNANLSEKEIAEFVELIQIYNPAGRKQNLNANQCACYTEYAGEWTICFHIIEGIRYHKSFGKRIAASLILSKQPTVCLSSRDSDSFYGFWGRPYLFRKQAKQQTSEGLSYWVNKNLYYNDGFRNFAVDFFSMMGTQKKSIFLKTLDAPSKGMVFSFRQFLMQK